MVLAIAFFIGVDRRVLPFIDRWDRGARGEEEVGAILDGIDDRGWFSIHDVSIGRGNIDHIAIGPAGVFTIETKHRRGSIHLDRVESRDLKQA